MLKTIAEVSPHLVAFTLVLRLSLSRPQQRHVMQIADALITTEGTKTLSGLFKTAPSSIARGRSIGKPSV
jgi:hypothetical protein